MCWAATWDGRSRRSENKAAGENDASGASIRGSDGHREGNTRLGGRDGLKYLQRNSLRSEFSMSHPPSPNARFFISQIPHMLGIRRDSLGFMRQITSDYGDVVRLKYGKLEVILVNHPDLGRLDEFVEPRTI